MEPRRTRKHGSSRKRNCSEKQRKVRTPKLLGDRIEQVTTITGIKGITEKVSNFLQVPCGCDERKEKINQLHLWAKRVISGKTEDAEVYLDSIIED